MATPMATEAALAKEKFVERGNDGLISLLNCRNITENQERLACFDQNAAIVARETALGELVPVYKAEIVEARRGLFGMDRLNVPSFLNNNTDRIEEVTTTLVSATRGGNDRWRLTLEDGTVWEQVDTSNPYFPTRAGTEVKIRRAALGSYMMNLGSAKAIRVTRRQ